MEKCQIYLLIDATLSVKMRFNFFHITTIEHRNVTIEKAFVVAIGIQVAFSKSCIMLDACQVFVNVMKQYYFYLFSNLYKLMGT